MKCPLWVRKALRIYFDPAIHAAPGPASASKKVKPKVNAPPPPNPKVKAVLKSGRHLVAGKAEGQDNQPWVLAESAGMLEGRRPLLTQWDMNELALIQMDADKASIIKPLWAEKIDKDGKLWSISKISNHLTGLYGKGSGYSDRPVSKCTGCFTRALLSEKKGEAKKAA